MKKHQLNPYWMKIQYISWPITEKVTSAKLITDEEISVEPIMDEEPSDETIKDLEPSAEPIMNEEPSAIKDEEPSAI